MVILTDGAITDMENTVAEIVRLSVLPCSIIIIGLGGADFTSMEQLDGDQGGLVDSSGVKAKRDIVQFVPFRKKMMSGDLAKSVLAEVPPQICEYMKGIGFDPKPTPQSIV